MTRRAAIRLRLAFAMLAWLAQAWMPVAHAVVMGAPAPAHAAFSNTYEVGAYRLWGLRAGYMGKRWEVHAEARNLGNRRYASMFSVRDMAAADAAILHPGEPRSVYVGARLTF